MFCPKCGRINPDDDITCKGCGAPLHEEENTEAEKKRGLSRWVLIVPAALAAVAVAVGIVSCNAAYAEALILM